MTEKEVSLKRIKEEILKCLNEMGVSVKEIILFGSRARGDFQPHSDWDFLIVIEEQLNIKEKRNLAHKIRKALAEIYIPSDVIIKSENEVKKRKNIIGSIVRSAIKTGITL